jgi:hypothetical protein
VIDLFFISLLGSIVGCVYCWYRWDDVVSYSSQPEPDKTLIFMFVGSTITFVFILFVFVVSGKVPL